MSLAMTRRRGVIEKMTGGVVGKAPDVVVDYDDQARHRESPCFASACSSASVVP